MDEELVQYRLYELRYLIAKGEFSDWEDPWFPDGTLMSDPTFRPTRLTTSWEEELAIVLVDLQVESVSPFDHTDSVGDRFARFFPPKAA
jgi:hypothetical protein